LFAPLKHSVDVFHFSVAPVRRSGSIARRNARVPRGRDDEQRLTADIIELAWQYGRYGYRKVAELLAHLVPQIGCTLGIPVLDAVNVQATLGQLDLLPLQVADL